MKDTKLFAMFALFERLSWSFQRKSFRFDKAFNKSHSAFVELSTKVSLLSEGFQIPFKEPAFELLELFFVQIRARSPKALRNSVRSPNAGQICHPPSSTHACHADQHQLIHRLNKSSEILSCGNLSWEIAALFTGKCNFNRLQIALLQTTASVRLKVKSGFTVQ